MPVDTEDKTSLRASEKMEVLVSMYEQLDQNHHHHNKVIHQNYYLSTVFFGAIISVILSNRQSEVLIALIGLFGSFVMLLLGIWTYMYTKARRQIKEHKSNIVQEMGLYNDEFTTMATVDEAFFFTHEETPERSIINKFSFWPFSALHDLEHIKDTAEWAYFVFLAGLMLVLAIGLIY